MDGGGALPGPSALGPSVARRLVGKLIRRGKNTPNMHRDQPGHNSPTHTRTGVETPTVAGAAGVTHGPRTLAVGSTGLTRLRCSYGSSSQQDMSDFAGDVAFETTDDLGFRQSFCGAACGIGAGCRGVTQSAEDDPVEGCIACLSPPRLSL